MTADASGLTGTTPTVFVNTSQEGDWWSAPACRLAPLGAEHQRPARQAAALPRQGRPDRAGRPEHADFGSGGAYTIPSGNLFPLVARRAAGE